MNLRHVRYALLCAGMTLVAAGCGDDPLDPDVTGLVNAVVHDAPAGTAAFTSTAAGNMHVSIRSTGGYLGRPGHAQWDYGSASELNSDLGPRIDERSGRHV